MTKEEMAKRLLDVVRQAAPKLEIETTAVVLEDEQHVVAVTTLAGEDFFIQVSDS